MSVVIALMPFGLCRRDRKPQHQTHTTLFAAPTTAASILSNEFSAILCAAAMQIRKRFRVERHKIFITWRLALGIVWHVPGVCPHTLFHSSTFCGIHIKLCETSFLLLFFFWLQLFQHKNSIFIAPFSHSPHTPHPFVISAFFAADVYHSCFKHIFKLRFLVRKSNTCQYVLFCNVDANNKKMMIRELIHWSWDFAAKAVIM